MEDKEIKLYEDIRGAFREAIEKIGADETVAITDIYVCIKYDELLLTIYDDAENILLQTTLDEWNELKEDQENTDATAIDTLKKALDTDEMRKAFESLDLITPFSVILINEDHEQITEILTIDKDLLILDNDFLKNIDQELDDFLDKLMADDK